MNKRELALLEQSFKQRRVQMTEVQKMKDMAFLRRGDLKFMIAGRQSNLRAKKFLADHPKKKRG